MATQKKMSKTQKNLWIDLVIFVMMVLVSIPAATGQGWHQILGVAFGAGITVHLVIHRQWIASTTRRFFSKMSRKARINYVMGVLLTLFTAIAIGTGIAIAPIFTSTPVEAVVNIHHASTKLLALLSIIHGVLHWGWIKSTAKLYMFSNNSVPQPSQTPS